MTADNKGRTVVSDSTPLTDLAQELQKLASKLKKQHKLLIELNKGQKDEDVPRMQKALKGLEGELFARCGMAAPLAQVQESSRQALAALRLEQRRELGRALEAGARETGRTFRKLAESPLEFLLAPFTVTVSFESMEATVLFAREPLAKVPARAERILAAIEKEEKALAGRKVTPETIFDGLLTAYRGLIGARGLPFGERVALSDVLPYMALSQQGARFAADPCRERFASYSKAQFLFDLAALRSARLLEHNGYRLDLGTATGDSVKRKSQVFFLQTPDGQGQYYLALRFVQPGRLL
jgi:hypothetical protein